MRIKIQTKTKAKMKLLFLTAVFSLIVGISKCYVWDPDYKTARK
jgi:hypothetical protein